MLLSSINDPAFDAHMKTTWTLMWLAVIVFIPIAAMGLHAVWFWLNWVFVPERDRNRRHCPTCGSPMPAPPGAASSIARTPPAPTQEAHS
jgi:hypothetical protein